MKANRRFAIITPYYREDRSIIERCVRSVLNQTLPADHFVIADGVPQAWLDTEPVRHIKLDRPHGNYGNTPRGVGSLIAITEEYEGIGFLDADNWLERQHVELCVDAATEARHMDGVEVDYVIAQRHLRRLDETIMPLPDEKVTDHVDTSCFFMLPSSFSVIPHLAMMPKQLSPICDRIFYGAIKTRGLKAVVVPQKTVNYQTLYEPPYRVLGEKLPPGAKPAVDMNAFQAWVNSLSPRQLSIASSLSGVQLAQSAKPPAA